MNQAQKEIIQSVWDLVKVEKAKPRFYIISISKIPVGNRETKADAELFAVYVRNEMLVVAMKTIKALVKLVDQPETTRGEIIAFLQSMQNPETWSGIEAVVAAKSRRS